MTTKTAEINIEAYGRLWRAVGAIESEANPDGLVARLRTPEERLAAIWEIVRSMKP